MTAYSKVIHKLEARVMMPEKAPSLEKTKEGLRRIGFYEWHYDPAKVIVVAGTNGKGSVCATLDALFTAAGENVGLYTSPHLMHYTERIRVGGKDVSQEMFCQAYEEVSEATQGLDLSHFETLTLMAIWIFASGKISSIVDRMILEVGLGGTWDSTNAIAHKVSAITTLGMDHENLLGNTLTSIAQNKFGIILEETDLVVHLPFVKELENLVQQTKKKTKSRWVEANGFEFFVEKNKSIDQEPVVELREWPMRVTPQMAFFQQPHQPQFFIKTKWGIIPLALPGKRAAQNTMLALTIFDELGFDVAQYSSALLQVRWPGRMERLCLGKTTIYFSGDHNPQGIQSLLELLPYYPRKHLHVLVGVGKEKDLDGMLTPLFSLPETSIYLTQTPFRGRLLNDYGAWIYKAKGAWVCPEEAFQNVIAKANPEDLILITGSLYLVGFLKKYINE